MSEVLVAHSLVSEPLVICSRKIHSSGRDGCFRCIDKKLIEMADTKDVRVFSFSHDSIKVSEQQGNEIDAMVFFDFLKSNNICFKVFLDPKECLKELTKIKILKTIPSIMKADTGEESLRLRLDQSVNLEPQQNFLDKFTTYYEYKPDHESDDAEGNFAFKLEFTQKVIVNDIEDKYVIYIILNKLCNDSIKLQTIDQLTIFHDQIRDAIKILNSYKYYHTDIHFPNIVDCGESSNPRYKLIDFAEMAHNHYDHNVDYNMFSESLLLYIKTTPAIASYAESFASKIEAAKKEDEAIREQRDAKVDADEKRAAEIKLKKIKDYSIELKKKIRFMVNDYISKYLHSMCPQALMLSVTSSHKKDSEMHSVYPSATFQFESLGDFKKCKTKLPMLELTEKSLTATYSSYEIQKLFEGEQNLDFDSMLYKEVKKYINIVKEVDDFLSSGVGVLRAWIKSKPTNDDEIITLNRFKMQIDSFSTFVDENTLYEKHEGGQKRYKLKRSTRRKTRTKSKSKSKNKHRTRRKSKSKSKSKNKHITRRK
jgi:hypothetical protein